VTKITRQGLFQLQTIIKNQIKNAFELIPTLLAHISLTLIVSAKICHGYFE
jgi:hypothetical protein